MFDKHETAVLRGFDTAVADIGDQLHICHPLLSFEGDPNTLYVARRLNWRNHQRALAVADPSEASELATLLPDEHRQPIASGEAAVVAGAGFIQAAADAGIQLDGSEVSFVRTHESGCWIATATQALFAELRTRLVDEARTEFDKELGNAAWRGQHLSERGNAALFLLRRCGPLRREDLAIRQLAGAKQNCELDLYQRLLVRFRFELGIQRDDLQREVEQRIALAASQLRSGVGYATRVSATGTTEIRPMKPTKTRILKHECLEDSGESHGIKTEAKLPRVGKFVGEQ